MLEEPKIIYEDKNFVAVSKPAGMLTHGIKISNSQFPISEERTLTDWLVRRYPEMKNVGDQPETRPGIVHRLDRETSGILLAARNQRYFEYLKSLFQERKIAKTYLAMVFGWPKEKAGKIIKPIKIKKGAIRRTVFKGRAAKEATTLYKVKKSFEFDGKKFSLLEVNPQTGRTHQIRTHLASIGHTIVGDKIYGPKKMPSSRMMLHAYSLEFSLPAGRRIRLEADPQQPLQSFITRSEKSYPQEN